MDLWIRSQDRKRLVKVFDIYIGGTYGSEIKANYAGYHSGCSYIDLGEYKTKERALEVLDEIQKILKPQLIIKDSGKIIGSIEDTLIREGTTYELKELSTIVYEMPKE